MTREEYLAELESNLVSLPKEERDMAVSFYSEYFDEAGPENEQAVIEDLGKPYSLARSIIGETSAYSRSEVYLKYKESKPMPQNSTGVFASLKKPDADIFNNAPNDDAFHAVGSAFENAQQDSEDRRPNENPANGGMFDDYYKNAGFQETAPPPPPEQNKKTMSTWLIVLLVFAGVFVGLPVLCGIIPAILAIIVAFLAIGAAAICCLVASVIALFVGVIRLFTAVPVGLGLIFTAIFCAGIGMVLLAAALAFFFKLLPFTVKGIAKLLRKRRAD